MKTIKRLQRNDFLIFENRIYLILGHIGSYEWGNMNQILATISFGNFRKINPRFSFETTTHKYKIIDGPNI